MDHALERVVLYRPRGRRALLWGLFVMLLLLGAFWLTPQRFPVDLFFFPVMVASFVFGPRGLTVLPAALAAHHSAWVLRGRLDPQSQFLSDLLHLIQWSVVASFVVVTLDKYKDVKRLQGRFQKDLSLARTLQMALTPPDYDFGKMRIYGSLHQSATVGGDYYYFRPFQEHYVVFCVGDVMGKGIPASMLMAIIMTFMFEWGKKSPSPAVVLDKLNRRLVRLASSDSHWFTTLYYAVYDESNRRLTYASAGQNQGLVLRRNGQVLQASGEGIPVGIFETAAWEEYSLDLEPGDRVILFTDGVNEARDPDGEIFTMERLIQLVEESRNLDSRALIKAVEQAVAHHSGGRLTDDMALVVAEVKD
ncbi:MAG: PP2C family protein-serine/threonine phosphatase [Candidatus Eremiobacterota bacterium]